MTTKPIAAKPIQRLFVELAEQEISNVASASLFAREDFRGSLGWDAVLLSKRILIVSEAGVGKTYECQSQQERLWNAGEPAFFLDLATLATGSVRDMLNSEEEARLDRWLRSQSEVATFFLDSIDELNLTLGKFDQALKRLNKALAGQLGRARIFITTRPVTIDRALIEQHLPFPITSEAEPTAADFADAVMDRKRKSVEAPKAKIWLNVGLRPLSLSQMREFAVTQNVTDPDALISDIEHRDAEQFAQRPQDLIELCSDWREHHRIRTHREQVKTNIETKLKPRTERKERASLSQEKAVDAAGRLALAAMLTRKLTLRHSAEVDSVEASEAALDASKILPDLSVDERSTLLERPLFGFASYGRVRFHHRSVVEHLAARRLETLIERGTSIKSVKRLLFTETAQGARTVRPSMRPVAAWLALTRGTIFDEVVAIDPAAVLDHGDPQSLTPTQRIKALESYVSRYGRGGWRGLSTPEIQVHRFASPELADIINQLFDDNIENPEVRNLLLRLIGAGKITASADTAYRLAMDHQRSVYERDYAIEALIELGDPRLETIAQSLESDPARWPEAVTRFAMITLFPTYLPVPRLVKLLTRVKEGPGTIGELNFRLPRNIGRLALSSAYLDELRQAIFDLLVDGTTWNKNKFPHLRTKRPDLMAAHLAACQRQCISGIRTREWIASALLAIRLSKDEHSSDEAVSELRLALNELSPAVRQAAFWAEDACLQSLSPSRDAWHRIFNLSEYGGIKLGAGKDAAWVRETLTDPRKPLDQREMMLWAEFNLLRRDGPDYREFIQSLKPLVADAPNLVAIIEDRLKPQATDPELRRMQSQHEKRAKQAEREAAKAHASWVTFWKEIAQTPNAVFAANRAENTAWNLWQAVERSGAESRASGWNRRFIETQFNKDVADRLRDTMMTIWRNNRATLRSERADSEKNTFLVKWQVGLAGIAAEAEDPNWAKRLSEEEAELACRYAPIELNGFPSWLESLAIEHPAAVDRILGQELTQSLGEVGGDSHSMILQDVSHASSILAALFIPRVRPWLMEVAKIDAEPNAQVSENNLRQAAEIMLKAGNKDDHQLLRELSAERLRKGLSVPFARVWLPILFRLDPPEAVRVLEKGLSTSEVSRKGAGVHIFADLFDGNHLAIDLRAPGFTPELLLRLARIAYQHVRKSDDTSNDSGARWVDERNRAERGRVTIINTIFAETGGAGWAAKLEMANDPLFGHLKDRAIAVAQERAAEEADSTALTEAEFAILDRSGEAPPSTAASMFSLMRDRLDDIDDLLLQDESPREAWANISVEHVMRREIARELRGGARGCYTVDQESVTADEKETDIRLRSTSSRQIGTIELKLGDGRSGKDLFDTIEHQLLSKYMAAEESRAGCLLVTIAKDRKWEHPTTGEDINFDQLVLLLNQEAKRLGQELGGNVMLMAKGLDLRPRLKKERAEPRTRRRSPSKEKGAKK
jgi:hypothetical protein